MLSYHWLCVGWFSNKFYIVSYDDDEDADEG